MRALIVVSLVVGGIWAGAESAPAARADGPCLFRGDWDCTGQPRWNGQLQQTWEVPPYTWPNNELQCNPYTQQCYPVSRP